MRGWEKSSRTLALFGLENFAFIARPRPGAYNIPTAMSIDVINKSNELIAQRKPFALATVVRVEGSSSAKPGSKAIIGVDGKIILGWIGGGCAESTVRREAINCITSEMPQLITLDMTDELLGVGMPCGGVMDVYIDPVLPKPELLIIGHGRIAETLAALGRIMGFSITVDDPIADRNAFPAADRILTNDLDLTEAAIGPHTFVVIATQHKGDHISLQKALEGNAAYIALITSKHRARLVLDYVALSGVPREKLDRVWAPAGLDLGACAPEEIALSIISQIVALRRDGDARPLKDKDDGESSSASAHPVEEHGARVITQCDAPDAG
jgi:xanthine dehydrogenase accessory factor